MATLVDAQLNELAGLAATAAPAGHVPPSTLTTQRSQLSELATTVHVTGHLAPSSLATQRDRLTELALANTERHPFVHCPEH